MKNIYFHPKIDYKLANTPNPYIFNLENSLTDNYNIVNKKYNHTGVLDFYKYILKTDLYLFNWIEDLPTKQFGKIQSMLFVLFIYIAKFLKIKTIWILHNKYPHDLVKNKWTDFLYKLLFKNIDLIITHSDSGIEYFRNIYPESYKKIKYYIHPLHDLELKEKVNIKNYKFLIWGNIKPYKGIVPFLKFINENGNKNDLKILIVGKCFDENYRKEICKYLNKNVTHYDRIFDFDKIAEFAQESEFILFTYQSESVLSSGALMDSIRMRSVIIGPNHGAFKDLNHHNFVYTYNNYLDILDIIANGRIDNKSITKEVNQFINQNSWSRFGVRLNQEILKLYLQK